MGIQIERKGVASSMPLSRGVVSKTTSHFDCTDWSSLSRNLPNFSPEAFYCVNAQPVLNQSKPPNPESYKMKG